MANPHHLAILNQGVATWNQWRRDHPDIRPDLSEATLVEVDLSEYDLSETNLSKANLTEANLQRAYLREANLEGANLETVHLEGARLYLSSLQWANLRYAYFDRTTNLDSIYVEKALVVDVRWGDVNLSIAGWEKINKKENMIFGDEFRALHPDEFRRLCPNLVGKKPLTLWDKRNDQLRDYRRAIRANRQVAAILRTQGVNEVANKLDYRAQVLQRKLLYRQALWGQMGVNAPNPNRWQRLRMYVTSILSWLLDLVAGYGYKPWHWIALYLVAIIIFTILQLGISHLQFPNAIAASILDLHGRPFFNQPTEQNSIIAIFESFVGLVLEAILVSIITQRILGKSGGS